MIWGVAALGTGLVSTTFGAMLAMFYQDYLGLDPALYSVAWVIYGIWNAINDPLFGYITDSTRTKLGRRIPYMRFTAPFLALTFILVWFAPQGGSDQAVFWWMLATMLLYDTCYTIIGLVYSALLPEVAESDAERNALQISSSLFNLAGLLLGFLIPDFFRPKAGTDPSFLPLQVAMIVIGVVSMVLIIATTLKVKERPEFTQVDKPLPVIPAVKYTFTSRSFLVVTAANFMSILMSSMVTLAVYYLADYVVKMPAIILLACLFIPLIIGVPITTLLRRRWGVVRTQQMMLVLAGIGLISITVVPAALIPVCVAVAGFGLAGPQTLTNVLFAQVADEDELRSGVRREGAFFGVNALLTKPAQSVANVFLAGVLAATSFVTREANAGQPFLNQAPEAILGIRVIAGLIPGAAMFLGALILTLYPLRGRRLAEVQQQVQALHEEKKEKLAAQS